MTDSMSTMQARVSHGQGMRSSVLRWSPQQVLCCIGEPLGRLQSPARDLMVRIQIISKTAPDITAATARIAASQMAQGVSIRASLSCMLNKAF